MPESHAESPARQLEGFLAKFDPPVARLIKDARAIMRKRFPTATEIVYDNYNFFVIGYSATERPTDCIASLAAAANGLGLSFYYGATLPDPHRVLLGGGKQNRFVRLPSARTLRAPAVAALLTAAAAQARVPLPATGRGKLVIKSISAKQRPRRKS